MFLFIYLLLVTTGYIYILESQKKIYQDKIKNIDLEITDIDESINLLNP